MFRVSTEQVIAGLERLRKRLCGYRGSRCDCKFGFGEVKFSDEAKALHYSMHGEQTGCPELRQAIEMVKEVGKLQERIAELEADPEAEAQRRLDKKMADLGYVPKEEP